MSTTQDRLRQAARFTRLDADRELLTEAADALDRREAVIRLLEGEVALAAPGVPDDAKRLNWLDDTNKRFRMGWEVGQAPAGHIIVFKPGQFTDQLDQITIDRLECITRRENMLRNTVHRYGKEIAQLVQLRSVLTRHINKKQKELGA